VEALQIQWSESKQKNLESQLVGFWAKDAWDIQQCPLKEERTPMTPYRLIRFRCICPSLNNELKYACWQKAENKEWSLKTLWQSSTAIKHIALWLNTVAPGASSLMQRSLVSWQLSFRSYLVELRHRNNRAKKRVQVTQLSKGNQSHPEITVFSQIYKTIQNAYDDRPEYEKDIWDLRKIGGLDNPSKSNYTITFVPITQPWLLQAAKQFIRYSLSIYSQAECCNRAVTLKNFSGFLSKHHPSAQPTDIDRPLIVEYISYLASDSHSNNTRLKYLSHLRMFLETCAREDWLDVLDKRLIYSEDFPKLDKPQPRYIPEEVMTQLNQNLDALPPNIRRMVLIIQEAGMRIGELCKISFNCLMQDAQGDYFLRYHQYKMKKEHSIPISKEVALVIQEQQQAVKQECGDFPFLFPSPRDWNKGKPMKQKLFSDTLNRLAHEKKIQDNTGTVWHFQAHQFRHTVGTRMINLGVPQHIIQRYLGHESPEMTNTYAHIHDQTLKQEFAKFKDKIVDIAGKAISHSEVVAEMTEGLNLNSIDDQWLKKNILAQALPNGLCGLPIVQGACPYGANKCLSCTHFKTDSRYLDKHKDHLERTNKIVEWAQENSESRRSQEILKENLPVKENLERIITSLENSQDEA
jgi:integrase